MDTELIITALSLCNQHESETGLLIPLGTANYLRLRMASAGEAEL